MAIVRISEPISFDLMGQELGVDVKQLNKWNGDYDLFEYGTYGEEVYPLRIQKDKLDAFLLKKEMLTNKSKDVYSALNM